MSDILCRVRFGARAVSRPFRVLIGSTVTVTVEFIDPATGRLVSGVSGVSLAATLPDGATETWTEDDLTPSNAGVWTRAVAPDQIGAWRFVGACAAPQTESADAYLAVVANSADPGATQPDASSAVALSAAGAATASERAARAEAILEEIRELLANVPPGGGPIRTVSANFQITNADKGVLIEAAAAAAIFGTVMAGADDNAAVDLVQLGAGFVQFEAGPGVTLIQAQGFRRTTGPGARVVLRHTGGNQWVLSGDLQAPVIAPSLSVPEGGFAVDEGLPAGALVGLVTNAGGPVETWTVDSAAFTAVPVAGGAEIRTAVELDYETTPNYDVTVTAANLVGSSSVLVKINVADVRETLPPQPVATGLSIAEVAQPGTVLGQVLNIGDPATSWEIVGGHSTFSVTNQGFVVLTGALDFDATPSYSFIVRATNTAGSADAEVNVAVLEVTEEPGSVTVTTMEVFGPANPEGHVYTFGYAFKQGDMPAGAQVMLRVSATGAPLRTQFEPFKAYPDGSTRFALMAVELPARAAGQVVKLDIRRGEAHPSPGANLSLATALQGRSAGVTITPTPAFTSGVPFTTDPLANPGSRVLYRNGPLVLTYRHEVEVPALAIGGATSMRLVCDVTITKTGRLTATVAPRNDMIQRAGAGIAFYSVALTGDGQQQFAYDVPSHAPRAWFSRTRSWMPGGASAAEDVMHVPEIAYQAELGTIAAYDERLGLADATVRNSSLQNIGTALASPGYDVPFSAPGMNYQLSGVGGQPYLGIGPDAAAAALLKSEAGWRLMLGQVEAGQGIPWHYWDHANREWINPVRQPNVYIQESSSGSPWRHDGAHQPDLQTIPFLLTGRQDCLDALMAQAAFCVVRQTLPNRKATAITATTPTGEAARLNEIRTTGVGAVLFSGSQIRTMAWSMRQVLHASFFAPPAKQPFGSYFDAVAEGNLIWLLAQRAAWTTLTGQIAGVFTEYEYGVADAYPPWQHDYTGQVLARAAIMGVPGARDFLLWQKNFTVGRFFNAPAFWGPDGVNYLIYPKLGNVFVKTWAEVGTRTAASAGGSYGPDPGVFPPTDYGDYARHALAHLIMLRQAFPDDGDYARAWDYLYHLNPVGAWTEDFRYQAQSRANFHAPGRTRADIAPRMVARAVSVPEDTAVGGTAFVAWALDGIPTTYTIVSGNSDGRFAIGARSGVVTVAGALTAGTHNRVLRIRAANEWGESEADVTLTVASAAPLVTAFAPASVPQNAPVGFVVARAASTRGTGITWSIASGNTGSLFAIDPATGVVTVAASLSGLQGEVRNLVVRATNAFSPASEQTLAATVIGTVTAPAIAAGQVFSMARAAAAGAAVGTVSATGTAPTFTLTNDAGGRFAINASTGAITRTAVGSFADLLEQSVTLGVRAENASGTADATVAVRVAEALTVHGFSESTVLLAAGLRRLRAGYLGPLVRIAVGTQDGSQFDIGADVNGNLSAAQLSAAVAGGPSWVITLYDQSELGQHLTQPTPTRRPQLTDASGATYSFGDGGNTRPVMRTATEGLGLRNTAFQTGGGLDIAALAMFEVQANTFSGHLATIYLNDTATSIGTDSRQVQLMSAQAGTLTTFRRTTVNTTLTLNHPTPLALNTAYAAASRYASGAPTRLYIDKTASADGGTTFGLVTPVGTLRVGYTSDAAGTNAGLRGLFSEIVVLARTSVPDLDAGSDSMRAYWTGAVVDPPLIAAGQSFNTVANAAPGATLGTLSWAGTALTEASLSGTGSTNFNISLSGTISIAAGASLSTGTYNLSATLTNTAGSDSENFSVVVAAAGVAPTLGGGPTFEVSNTAAVGTAVGTVTVSAGTPPIAFSISANDTPFYSIDAGGVVRVESSLLAAPALATFTVQGQNLAGIGTRDISVQIAEATTIYGLTTGTAVIGLYGLRRLRSTYTGPLVRLRRASDNAEQDFGMDGSGHLDWTAVAAWVGAQASFVTTWYDQGARGNHLVQTVAGRQPQITDSSGAQYAQGGRPTIRFQGSGTGITGLRRPGFTGPTSKLGVIMGARRNANVFDGMAVSLFVDAAATSVSANAASAVLLNQQGSGSEQKLTTSRRFGASLTALSHPDTWAINTPVVVGARFPGAGAPLRNYTNGVWSGDGQQWSENFAAAGELRVGFFHDGASTSVFNGQLWELVITADVTDADFDTVRADMRAYWGY